MQFLKATMASLVLLIVGTIADAAQFPPPLQPTPFEAKYSASYNGLPIETTRTLAKSGETFEAVTEADNFLGSIREAETFRVDDKGSVDSTSYQYSRSILGKERTENSSFTANGRRASNTYKGETLRFDSVDHLLGPLGYQTQMQLDLLRGASDLRYAVLSRGKIRDYQFARQGNEAISTSLGTLDTIVVDRLRTESTRKTRIWLAPNLGYLPVKLVQEEDGERYEMQIESYRTLAE